MIARRVLFWLSLIAVLTGTPTRQVEAADDLARTRTEADDDDRVGEVDGGVGDDALEALAPDAGLHDPAAGPGIWSGVELIAGMFAPAPERIRSERAADATRSAWPPGPARRRQSWLQRFRL